MMLLVLTWHLVMVLSHQLLSGLCCAGCAMPQRLCRGVSCLLLLRLRLQGEVPEAHKSSRHLSCTADDAPLPLATNLVARGRATNLVASALNALSDPSKD